MFNVYDIYLEEAMESYNDYDYEIGMEGKIGNWFKGLGRTLLAMIQKVIDLADRVILTIKHKKKTYPVPEFFKQFVLDAGELVNSEPNKGEMKDIPINNGAFDHDALEKKFKGLTRKRGQSVDEWLKVEYTKTATQTKGSDIIQYPGDALIKILKEFQENSRSIKKIIGSMEMSGDSKDELVYYHALLGESLLIIDTVRGIININDFGDRNTKLLDDRLKENNRRHNEKVSELSSGLITKASTLDKDGNIVEVVKDAEGKIVIDASLFIDFANRPEVIDKYMKNKNVSFLY